MAVEANLVLYLQEKANAGPQGLEKDGRPLLAYAVVPRSLAVRCGSCKPEILQLLLERGGGPNSTYSEEEGQTGQARSLRLSVCQWALCAALERYRLAEARRGDFKSGIKEQGSWRWTAWRDSMVILVSNGADVNATVERKELIERSSSALLVCYALSQLEPEKDATLPKLLIRKGAMLLPGELDDRTDLQATFRILPIVFREWARFLGPHQAYPNVISARKREQDPMPLVVGRERDVDGKEKVSHSARLRQRARQRRRAEE